MSRIERFQPGTKVSDWASGSIVANPGKGMEYAGYFAGGRGGITTVDRFLFNDDSRTTLGTGLSQNVRTGMCFANAGVAGYYSGGNTSGAPDVRHNFIDKFLFTNDSRSTLSATLSSTVDGGAGMSNSGTAGYAAGGYDGDATSYTTRVDKIAFSNDSKSTLGTGLSLARGAVPGGMSNSGTAGYIHGGHSGSGSAVVDKFAFSNDARSTLGTGLSVARWSMCGFSNSGTAGYAAGGTATGTYDGVVDKFAFSNDARSTLGTGLSESVYGQAGMANSGTAGYVGGGYPLTDVINKFAFSNDGRTTLGTGLSATRNNATGFANSEALI